MENRKIECACGCGELIWKSDKWDRPRKFVKGHWLKKNQISFKSFDPEERIICDCGCGQERLRFNINGVEVRFIHNHNKRKKPKKNKLILCACGCGEMRWEYNEWGKKVKMIHTHIARLQPTGKDSRLWKGGKSFEPYPPKFNNQLKLKIRKRDEYCCMLCKVKENGRKHSVHHIDYTKDNNNPLNLVTLCYACHGKTNYNRKQWQKYFEELMSVHKRPLLITT